MELVDDISQMQFRHGGAASAVRRSAVIDETYRVGLMFVSGQPNTSGGCVVELSSVTNAREI